jgi:hypothetical protein
MHLLFLHHPLAHDVIDRGLRETSADPFAAAITLAIVDDRSGVGRGRRSRASSGCLYARAHTARFPLASPARSSRSRAYAGADAGCTGDGHRPASGRQRRRPAPTDSAGHCRRPWSHDWSGSGSPQPRQRAVPCRAYGGSACGVAVGPNTTMRSTPCLGARTRSASRPVSSNTSPRRRASTHARLPQDGQDQAIGTGRCNNSGIERLLLARLADRPW